MKSFFKTLVKKNNKGFLFISEISANHNQLLANAKKLIVNSKKNGSDFVKFQTYEPNSLSLKSNNNKFLIKDGLWKSKNLWDLYSQACTPYSWQNKLFKYAKKIKIKAFSSPFDIIGVDLLERLNCPIYKIASLEANNFPLLKRIAKTGKPIIFSTGTSNLNEIKTTFNFLKKNKSGDIAILYCVSNYPADIKDFRFNNIKILKEKFKCTVGFSDHSTNFDVAKTAIAHGAEIIERHIMLNDSPNTPDSKFSTETKYLKKFINDLVNIKNMSKESDYFLSINELKNKKYRKSLYVAKNIKKNEKFNYNNTILARPKIGLDPLYIDDIKNLKSPTNLNYGTSITKKLYKKIIEFNYKKKNEKKKV